jgi:hypothetical protein
MAQSSVGRGPIPPANHDDPEDVAWALSTAEAMYARGERGDALKWLRRAAEAAAENDSAGRAVQLAKAAADLAGALSRTAPPAPPSARPASQPKPSPPSLPPSQTPAARTGAGIVPSPLRAAASGAASGAFRRAESTPAIDEPPPEVTLDSLPGPVSSQTAPATKRDSTPVIARGADVSIPDLLRDDDLADEPEEKTRIGVPAYQAGAMAAAETPEPPQVAEPSLRPSQAMRVIVWRGPDGVHVAPHGTHVSAIAVDAFLVALDPSADLAAWLSKK